MEDEIRFQWLVNSPSFRHFPDSLPVFILGDGGEDDDGNFYHELLRFYLVFFLFALIFITELTIEKTRKRMFHLVFFVNIEKRGFLSKLFLNCWTSNATLTARKKSPSKSCNKYIIQLICRTKLMRG